ncbi:MAG: transposase [Phycisphaerae bacterium]
MPQSACPSELVPQCQERTPAFELSFSCFQHMPLLTNDQWNGMLSAGIERAIERHDFGLVAFVFMPEHVHLLVTQRRPAESIPRLLYMMKRTFSHWVKQELHMSEHPLLRQLTIREKPGRYIFRFWEPGPGRIRALASPAALIAAIDTIHANPVRRGLCDAPDQWRWSSWRQHHLPTQPPDRDLLRIRAPSASAGFRRR